MSYVDRIDTEHINKCPHDKKVKCVERFGVKIFLHDDGSPCSLLNSFALNGDDLNKEDVKLARAKAEAKSVFEMLEDPSVYARLSTDEDILRRLAEELDKEKSLKRLEEMFLQLIKQKNVIEVINALSKYVDRGILINNAVAVYVKYRGDYDLEHCIPLVKEYLKIKGELKN